MKINLFRISPDGDNYSISQDNKDVAEELSDLLGSEPSFQCDFSLKPLGDAIEVKGHFKGHSPQDCSFCGEGYPYPILIEFSEYLVPKEPPKKSQKQTSQEDELDQEDGLGVEFENFYPARFLRDRIGFALPFQVPCKTAEDKCENYAYAQKAVNRHKAPETDESNPFSALKNLEIDKKR